MRYWSNASNFICEYYVFLVLIGNVTRTTRSPLSWVKIAP